MQNKINIIIFLVIALITLLVVSIGIILPAFISSAWASFSWLIIICAFYIGALIIFSVWLSIKIVGKIKEFSE
jgi:hypothetical protein